jgi:hypothetical protein
MATAKLSDEALLAVLQAHPGLRARIVSIVSAIENSLREISRRPMRPKNASSRRCGFWGVRRCRGGGKHAEVTEREIRQQPHMHRQGKKSSLAYEARRNRDLRAAIPFREGTRSSVRAECASNASDVFAALAARHHRFCRRSIFRSRANRIAGALRLYDWREHDPEDRSGPRPEHVRGRSTFPRFSQNGGSSQAYHISNRWRDDPHRRAGPRPEGQAYRQAALMERGQDFAGARQGRAVQRSLRKTIASTASRPPSAAANRS